MEPFLLAEKVAASAAIGLLIGLEREWAHKDVGVRSFALATLLGTLAWLLSPTFAVVEVGVVSIIIVLVNVYALQNHQPLEVTTSLALATTNVLGVLVGSGSFFLAFACAVVVTALLSWKTELVTFTSKLSVTEIRGGLLMAFISAVIYPLLPKGTIDPWHLINPRSIWFTVIVVSALSFLNYVLLRLYGAKGMRYSAILGGLVNSAAVSLLLGQQLRGDPDALEEVAANFLLADLSMIFRNGALVAIFSWAAGPEAAIAMLLVLGPMMVVVAILAFVSLLRSGKKNQPSSRPLPLRSPLDLRSVLRFAVLFFSLTILSGIGELLFGAVGFLLVVVVGALASAASSAVLVGTHVLQHSITPGAAALAIFFASLVGLMENVLIVTTVTHNRAAGIRLLLLTLPIVLIGGIALGLNLFLGW
ncbi:MAG TPA: DUF4010 domain-containing protein [Ktedonobacteraceae bacterium]|nr:DUF4010 domain-containing protein [Ktedonobacteraceae bacterium]